MGIKDLEMQQLAYCLLRPYITKRIDISDEDLDLDYKSFAEIIDLSSMQLEC